MNKIIELIQILKELEVPVIDPIISVYPLGGNLNEILSYQQELDLESSGK